MQTVKSEESFSAIWMLTPAKLDCCSGDDETNRASQNGRAHIVLRMVDGNPTN